jgi:16S rRNA (guanine966-N2)-methyltransferase
MRIIAGEHRGRRIQAPPGEGTRPMLDRVREALFSSLGDLVDGARVLDLFAGSGSLGLEAASRGAASVRAVERGGRALKALRKNVETLGLGESVEVVRADALAPPSWGEGELDLVFLDPPYPLFAGAERGRILGALHELAGERLAPGGLCVMHVPARGARESELAPDGSGLEAHERLYGTSALWYVERADGGDA